MPAKPPPVAEPSLLARGVFALTRHGDLATAALAGIWLWVTGLAADAAVTAASPLSLTAALVIWIAAVIVLVATRVPSLPIGAGIRTTLRLVASLLLVAALAAVAMAPAALGLWVVPCVQAALGLGVTALLAVLAVFVGLAAATLVSLGFHGTSLWLVLLAVTFPALLSSLLVALLSRTARIAEIEARAAAERDVATGLLNGASFRALLQRQTTGTHSVIVAEIDRLHPAADSLDPEIRKAALTALVGALERSIRDSDIGGRLGEDRLAVYLPAANAEMAQAIGQRLRNNLWNSLFPAGGRMLRATAVVGIATAPTDGREAELLLGAAERSLRRDKELRRPPPDGAP